MLITSNRRRIALFSGLLLVILVMAVSAACPETQLTVPWSDVTIDNPGALEPGGEMVMSIRVDFPDKENTTYPGTNQLELTSGLDSPYWIWTIVRDGVKRPENEERKSRVIIDGSDLSYPANTSLYLRIQLYGTAPSITGESKNLTVMKIQDLAGMSCVNDPVYQYNAHVLNTTVTRQKINNLYAELARLRADAALKNQTGAGTSRVMEKIDEAQRSLDTANATPVFEFVSVGLALDKTEAAIADGRRLLADMPVSGTMVPQQTDAGVQKELPGTPQQTPASPAAAPVPVFAVLVACLVVATIVKLERR